MKRLRRINQTITDSSCTFRDPGPLVEQASDIVKRLKIDFLHNGPLRAQRCDRCPEMVRLSHVTEGFQ